MAFDPVMNDCANWLTLSFIASVGLVLLSPWLLTRVSAAAGGASTVSAMIAAIVVISLAVRSAGWAVVDLSFPIHPRPRSAVSRSRLVPLSWVFTALMLFLIRASVCFHVRRQWPRRSWLVSSDPGLRSGSGSCSRRRER